MKLDGSEATVVNDDNPMVICVNGDTLAYAGMDMTDFSMKQTFLKTDATSRKDFLVPMNNSNDNQNPEKGNSEKENLKSENVQLFKMDEEASTGQINAKLISAFYLGETLTANMTVTNLTGDTLELSQLIAFIDETENLNDFAAMYADITNDPGKDDAGYQAPMDKLVKRMSLQPGETKVLQLSWEFSKQDKYEVNISSGEIVFIGLYDQEGEFKAKIEFVPVNKENPGKKNLKMENVQIVKMNEEASTGEIQAKLIVAFSLGENLITNLTVTNLTGKLLELSQLIAFIDEADNWNDFEGMYYDITNIRGKDDAGFQVPLEKMDKRMSLQPNETKVLQVSWDLNKKDGKTSSGDIVFIGLFDQGMELKALIEFTPEKNE